MALDCEIVEGGRVAVGDPVALLDDETVSAQAPYFRRRTLARDSGAKPS
jgi:hypothetical protein